MRIDLDRLRAIETRAADLRMLSLARMETTRDLRLARQRLEIHLDRLRSAARNPRRGVIDIRGSNPANLSIPPQMLPSDLRDEIAEQEAMLKKAGEDLRAATQTAQEATERWAAAQELATACLTYSKQLTTT